MSSNKLKNKVSRVDALNLLRLLHHIATHGGVASPELCELLDVKRGTVHRMITNANVQYGVKIEWRADRSLPSQGEYSLADWGVFNPLKIKKFIDDRQ